MKISNTPRLKKSGNYAQQVRQPSGRQLHISSAELLKEYLHQLRAK